MTHTAPYRPDLAALVGMVLAVAIPAWLLWEIHVRAVWSIAQGAVPLSIMPWATLAWVRLVERRPWASIGLRRLSGVGLLFGLAGAVVNVGISAGIAWSSEALGLIAPPSSLLQQLSGWQIVLFVTNGALLTEITFRGYLLERLRTLLRGQIRMASVGQLVATCGLFYLARGAPQALVWAVDDLAFTAFFWWRRDLSACLLAHLLPNAVASSLVALNLAG